MQHSQYQLEIFRNIRDTDQNICVEAGPGSGKTTTLLDALSLIPRTKKSIFLSFSNTIVNELKERVPSHIKSSTLHSLGAKMIMRYYRGVKIDEDKWFKFLASELDTDERTKENFRECGRVAEILNYARMTLTDLNWESMLEMCHYYDLDYTVEGIYRAIGHLQTPVRSVNKIDFADMIYLPVINPKIINESFDYVLLDEAQDLNNAQRAFIEGIIKPGGRLISVGDSKQSIYSFSGSSIDSFDKLKARPNTVTLPLSISYRCPQAVVREAQKVYDNIQPYEKNEEGEVRRGDLEEVEEGDMVLCRVTLPLISAFFYLLDKGIKSTVVGKEFEKGLQQFASRVQCSTVEETLLRIEAEKGVLSRELRSFGFKNILTHPRYVALLEKIDVLRLLIRKTNDPGNLSATIKEIFRDDVEAVKLMTIHRSKGLENDRVFVVDNFNGKRTIPSSYASQGWELIQERNLLFVAITRSKKELIYINIDE